MLKLHHLAHALLFLLLAAFAGHGGAQTLAGITPQTLAVVVNQDDPDSLEVGEYYLGARGIPSANLIKISLPRQKPRLTAAEFARLQKEVAAQLSPDIQAIVMIWTMPYAVECNAITSAMTLGFNAAQCKKTCNPGEKSKYFDAATRQPFTDLALRPSMLLPVTSVNEAKALIDRGILSAFRLNPGSAYLLITSDKARNARVPYFPRSTSIPEKKLTIHTMQADSIENKQDVMFYFTGLRSVPKLDTLNFLPGAIADHLTSAGGDLLGKDQMSSLRWLAAGATGSYGTVSEPCNYWQKFPNPAVLIKHYLQGETLIESYWKSVAWPVQGLFIGEPLAAPYATGRP